MFEEQITLLYETFNLKICYSLRLIFCHSNKFFDYHEFVLQETLKLELNFFSKKTFNKTFFIKESF